MFSECFYSINKTLKRSKVYVDRDFCAFCRCITPLMFRKLKRVEKIKFTLKFVKHCVNYCVQSNERRPTYMQRTHINVPIGVHAFRIREFNSVQCMWCSLNEAVNALLPAWLWGRRRRGRRTVSDRSDLARRWRPEARPPVPSAGRTGSDTQTPGRRYRPMEVGQSRQIHRHTVLLSSGLGLARWSWLHHWSFIAPSF